MSGYIRALVERRRAERALRERTDAERECMLSESREAAEFARDALIAAAWQQYQEERADLLQNAKGEPGPIGPMPRHEWKGTKLRFEIAPGEWGQWVDLRGKPGKDGERVVVVGGGGSSSTAAATSSPDLFAFAAAHG